MKILMQCRSTFYNFGGGDKIQLESTAEELRKLGHDVTIANRYVHDLSQYDIVHLFNIQIEPHSFFIYLLRAKEVGKPVALSTIYWNPDEWKKHDETPVEVSGNQTINRVKALFSNKFKGVPLSRLPRFFVASRELRQWLKMALIKPSSGEATHFIKCCLIESVDIILPNGASEGTQVARDFVKPKRSLFVPNGVTNEFMEGSGEEFTKQYGLKDFVLSVGRIESRKNVLGLARATRQLGLQLVLIGNDSVEPAYTQAVKTAAGDKILIIKEMPHNQLGSAYHAAKIHALASWFETPGISSLEAASAGCNIVTTEVGTTREYFGDRAFYCDPSNERSIVEALRKAYIAKKTTGLRDFVLAHFTWKDAALATLRGYEQIRVKP